MAKRGESIPLTLLPGLIILAGVFYLPLLVIIVMSFASRVPNSFALQYWPPTLSNYMAVFNPLYLNVLISTVRVIGSATLITLLLGFPLALFIHQQKKRVRNISLLLLMLPFFANFLARIYAWFIILKPNGVLDSFYEGAGSLLNTETALVIGIVSTYLPFFVYPVYFSLDRLDLNLVDAAFNLGASSTQVLFRVVIPLCRPGIVAGLVLVALPALGEFIIAKMVGGGLIPIAAMLVETTFLGKVTPNWPFGAALSVIIMTVVMVGLYILKRVTPGMQEAPH